MNDRLIMIIMRALCVIGIGLNLIMLLIKQEKIDRASRGEKNVKDSMNVRNIATTAIIGFVANFFDTIGIGSFASSASSFEITKSVDSSLIPGTLNVGDTVPVCLEAFLFLGAFNIDPITYVSMCISAIAGSILGSRIVSKWDKMKIYWGFGIGLFILSVIMLLRELNFGPFAMININAQPDWVGTVQNGIKYADVNGVVAGVGLTGTKLVIALIINFILGSFMCLGIGIYAPCMVLCVLMGLHTGMAFPLMMGSCAYLMAFDNGPKFIREGKYDISACFTQATLGAAGVFIAFQIVKSLPLNDLTILVIIVCFITSILYLKDVATAKGNF